MLRAYSCTCGRKRREDLHFSYYKDMTRLRPENVQFAIVSFEGPDEYSRGGGQAVRVRDLCGALADDGFHTHLFFVGDPALPETESHGNLTLHRWSQWVSEHHPGGVYDGEWGKMQDMSATLPSFLCEHVVRAGAMEGRITVLMGEDWQTATTMVAAAGALTEQDLLRYVIPVWTANTTFGFQSINWPALTGAAVPMTVSRYMKHDMWRYGFNPLVCSNGISPSSLVSPPTADVRALRKAFNTDLALFKIGRFSPDKRWTMAVDAIAMLKQSDISARFLMRGDRAPHGEEVMARAQNAGLTVVDLSERYEDSRSLSAAIASHPEANVLNLTDFLPDALLPTIYAAVDGVLANSGHEPFGLVGLEVMGAGGLAFVGSTGEEYAESDRNAVVLDTDDPREIMVQLQRLKSDAESVREIKRCGKQTAQQYLWPNVLRELFLKLEYVAMARGVTIPEVEQG